MKLADRTDRIQPFQVMQILARAKTLAEQGRSVIGLYVGEPDFGTPQAIIEAGQAALANGHTGYTPATGLPPLRAAIAERYRRWHGVEVAPERILVTPGGSSALLLAFAASIDSGRDVLLPEPGYPCNRNFLEVIGAQSISVPLAEQGLRLSLPHLETAVTQNAQGLLLASPCNPTGQVLTLDEWQQAADFAQRHDLALFADEIYHGLTFTDELPPSALNVTDDVWVTQSFSKFYGMTGWRLGWLVVPTYAIEAAERLAQNLYLSAPSMAQHAALAAFEPAVEAECFARRDALRARRDYLAPQLEALGLPLLAQPDGAFYLYADMSAYGDDAVAWCDRLLEETGVAITPGIDFGGATQKNAVRIAYTAEVSVLEEAVDRLAGFIGRR
ncbi:aminotransferase class I/II-fold pyridoxal phosphate-dependent enzyme [Saccharospirillum sp. MSK14-1]|uniref:aminotransferase class I/II-fold pyridoxal phosphate-dependent enzyme n=1 Tax=Saccharospirillum sp. MSK14-1 TaxID=1897632 RepID=UPI000D378628|nr:aminotransferase class I/II-fold pyridoxal phosphate-dependent enzyme [Saccharospirillum sp. MSK14-1]